MGHERVGILPKSERWISVVESLAAFTEDKNNVPEIAQQTLKNVQSRFKGIENDSGVQAAFQFLVLFSIAAKQKNPSDFFEKKGIKLSDDITPLQIAKAVNEWISKKSESQEYASFAQSAVIDAVSEWYKKNQTFQENLFSGDKNHFEVWRKSADGSGFSELSRLYFSKFTERYLKYFLERSASANTDNISIRNNFNSLLEEHINKISQHAFESSKITQSFAAGWFNKNAKDREPTQSEIRGFLNIAFGKIRGELLREQNLR